jgi:hypothetical protein
MKQHASLIPRTLTALILAAITLGVTAEPRRTTEENPVNSSSLDQTQARDFVALLSEVVQNVLARQGRADAFLSVRLDRRHSRLVIDLTQEYLPYGQRHLGGELEDRLHVITTEVVQVSNLDLKIVIENVDYTFDGQGLHYYFPDDFPD